MRSLLAVTRVVLLTLAMVFAVQAESDDSVSKLYQRSVPLIALAYPVSGGQNELKEWYGYNSSRVNFIIS